MLTAIRIAATIGMAVFLVASFCSFVLKVPEWLLLSSALVVMVGGIVAGALADRDHNG